MTTYIGCQLYAKRDTQLRLSCDTMLRAYESNILYLVTTPLQVKKDLVSNISQSLPVQGRLSLAQLSRTCPQKSGPKGRSPRDDGCRIGKPRRTIVSKANLECYLHM